MIQKLEQIKTRYEEVKHLIMDSNSMNDMSYYAKINKEYKELEKIIIPFNKYKQLLSEIEEAKIILENEKDAELREIAKWQLEELVPQEEEMQETLKKLLIPRDPNDSKNAILEIRAGTGGDEASIFAGDLFRMYQRYSENKKWKINIVDFTNGTAGGYKEIVATITGNNVYSEMKFESGVHRVQRIPHTETQGRIHTSAATVAVLPEMEDVEVQINMNDVKKETFCSSGAGGQSVNTTYSAVRLTHIPSGVVVSCQDERSQIKNFDKALKILRSRIYEMELKKHTEQIGAQRKSMVGNGDRSDKIRTYNYPQSRVTDHRIGYTVYNLPTVMDGKIEDFIEQLQITESTERLKEGVAK
ncbi:MAG: peptide chain release factor 1 [Chitinophagaceae bacterium]|nr:peptide chain release factor 1 [Chitinophagaceae bacterium]